MKEEKTIKITGHTVATLVAHAISYPDRRERRFIADQKVKAMDANTSASFVAYAISYPKKR